jgi:hypothetical protein
VVTYAFEEAHGAKPLIASASDPCCACRYDPWLVAVAVPGRSQKLVHRVTRSRFGRMASASPAPRSEP